MRLREFNKYLGGWLPKITEPSHGLELNMNSALALARAWREQCLFLSLAFWGTPSSVDTFTMAEKSSSAFSHEERTMSPETEAISPASQASDQPGDNVSPPTPRTHGKLNNRTHHNSFKSEDNLTEGVSFLNNGY